MTGDVDHNQLPYQTFRSNTELPLKFEVRKMHIVYINQNMILLTFQGEKHILELYIFNTKTKSDIITFEKKTEIKKYTRPIFKIIRLREFKKSIQCENILHFYAYVMLDSRNYLIMSRLFYNDSLLFTVTCSIATFLAFSTLEEKFCFI